MRDISTKINNGGATADGRLEASEYNDVQLDIENGVIRSGQTLNAADTLQMGRQSFLNAVGAQSFIDSGTANAIVLTPTTGASGYVMAQNYAQLNGARFLFTVAAANTGPVTINVGQTAGTLLGVKALVDLNGLALTPGFYQIGDLIEAQFNLSADNFVLINNLTKNATPSNYIVRYITTANITLSGLGTQAGGDWPAALTAGDLVLVANQTTGGDNGWYNAAAGAWTRATFANTSAKIISGSLTQVKEGTSFSDTIWMLTTDGAIILGTTSLVFVRKDDYSAHGQCKMVLSAGNIKLNPFNGNKIIINGVAQTIPSAGLTLAATGLTPGTLYYIYAYMSSGAMALESSTTGHSTDATTGVEIKTGDASRTLVGMAEPIAGPAWVDSAMQRLVISWFNRSDVYGAATGVTPVTSSSAPVELSTGLRVKFLSWGGAIGTRCSGDVSATAASTAGLTTNIDTLPINSPVTVAIDSSGDRENVSHSTESAPPEGSNTASLYGAISGAVATWNNFTLFVKLKG